MAIRTDLALDAINGALSRSALYSDMWLANEGRRLAVEEAGRSVLVAWDALGLDGGGPAEFAALGTALEGLRRLTDGEYDPHVGMVRDGGRLCDLCYRAHGWRVPTP